MKGRRAEPGAVKLRLDPALERTLETCAEELDALDADWAIAGATAMHAHGYARATHDIDLFVGDSARRELLERLRARGLPVQAIFSPIHYRITPPRRRDPEAAIDLLFPALGVESLGLLAARRTSLGGTPMPVIPIHHLVAQKLTTDPEIDAARHVRDLADLVALRDRGLIDASRVLVILDDVGDAEAGARLRELLTGSGGAAKKEVARRRGRGG